MWTGKRDFKKNGHTYHKKILARYCKTGNFRVQENSAIFAKIGWFAKISCRENVVF